MGPSEAGERFVDVVLPLPLRRSFTYRVPADLEVPPPGSRVRVPFGAGVETAFVVKALRRGELEPGLRGAPGRIKELASVLDETPWLDPALLRLARWLEGYYAASLGETLRAMIPVKPMKRPPALAEGGSASGKAPPVLIPAQAEALAAIEAALAAGGYAAFLLDGVTGSGKTEVYLRAIAAVLAAGRQAIVLVPEISLTPQMGRRFRERLGPRVGVFHSGLGAGERFAVWRAARDGHLDVVLGPRSAVFAPLPRLGLIVLDEEHDGSYKQAEKPRYHARSVALMRARDLGIPVVLGSATPSLESFHNAGLGKHRRLVLPTRVGGDAPPLPEIVPLAEAEGLLSAPLAEALEDCVAGGHKAMLLLNRRGHSRVRLCAACGERRVCGRCDITLTYHSRKGRLVCHYCGQERLPDPTCPACGAERWILLGAGTQQLELELGLRFPDLPVLRMDLDSTRRRGAHAALLERFADPGPALLLGTQMIAKGHHFPQVTLVGVVLADTGLFLPDFRAAERSWQLLAQVSGRAGRGVEAGRVLVQTWNPEHPVFGALAAGRLDALIAAELAEREALGYPPFRRLASLLVSGPDPETAKAAAERLRAGFVREWPEAAVELLGPAEAFLPRIKSRHRWQLLAKGSLSGEQKRWFAEAFGPIAKALGRSGALSLDLDVDPETIL